MQLEVKGVYQQFGESEILKGVDLSVKQGEVFVIIGPTGSGKTTLLRIIGLLDKPTSGALYFGGHEVTDSESARLDVRRKLAIVFQKPAVFNTSVYDNVAYGLKIRNEKDDSLRSKVQNALETVGLSGYENRRARTLSGGEIQRVALARAMVIEPELLLLDEPTANLDPVSTANVEKLISQVIQKLDSTVIMSTHDMFQGQRLADRMGVIIAGEMLQTGDPREIFSLPQGREIAEFVGMENILSGKVSSNEGGMVTIGIDNTVVEGISNLDAGTEVYACIRPEEITLARAKDSTSARNTFPAEITRIVLFGPLARVEMDTGFPLIALITKRSAEEMDLQTGTRIHASFKATGVHIIPR
ncbi:MAG: ABC transporter ATP-binding protein [Chloroflexota bacterium]|nr:ABC transporter ATP-binding protein [Chloroflexota bacterium]